MITEVVDAKTHVGFNETTFGAMNLTGRGTTRRETREETFPPKQCGSLQHTTGGRDPISPDSSADRLNPGC